MTRGRLDPHFMTAGAELTGVHILQNRTPPTLTAYHIGGGGIFLDEPIIRVLGETIERYSQLLSEVSFGSRFIVASYDEMSSRGEPVILRAHLKFFTDEQFAIPQMPFQPFDATRPMTWTKVRLLTSSSEIWVPAQLLLVGHRPKTENGELWLRAALTTGTASHTVPERTLRNALLEIIQIDAAMGHWYTYRKASEIRLDQRTTGLSHLLAKHFLQPGIKPKFYWMPNADLPGLPVACVIRSYKLLPAIGVGLGCDLSLGQAMYKALLEAVSVRQLAKIDLLYQTQPGVEQAASAEPGPFVDFDGNVAFYAKPGNHESIDAKFTADAPIQASDLPADSGLSVKEQNELLVDSFRRTNKQLLFMDLSTEDVRTLGFYTFRVASPDTITLCLPSFPPMSQHRFQSYGAVCHSRPHPYA